MLSTPPKRRQISQKMPVPMLLTKLETPLRENFKAIYQNIERIISTTPAYGLPKHLFLRKKQFYVLLNKKKNYTTPPSKAQRAQQKRKRREFKSQRHWRTTRKECLPDTEGLLHTGPHLAVTARARPTQSQT